MSSNIIYPKGKEKVTIPSGESIAVYTQGVALVYRDYGYPNMPSKRELVGTVTNGQTVFGSYASGATIVIESGAGRTFYQVGVAPIVTEIYALRYQGAPTAKTTTATLTTAELLTGLLTGTHAAGSTQTYTLPTGANMDLASEFAVGDAFDWTIINLSAAAADTITVAASTGHTIVGGVIVQSAHSTTGTLYGNAVTFRTRKTAADTFITYRIGG